MDTSHKLLGRIFLVALFLNFIWEYLHVVLYAHYKGGPIPELMLLRAPFVDAVIITALAAGMLYIGLLRRNPWIILLLAVAVAVGIELWALETGRWAYKEVMPLVPFLGTGLSPTVQLAVTAYVTFKICLKTQANRL